MDNLATKSSPYNNSLVASLAISNTILYKLEGSQFEAGCCYFYYVNQLIIMFLNALDTNNLQSILWGTKPLYRVYPWKHTLCKIIPWVF